MCDSGRPPHVSAKFQYRYARIFFALNHQSPSVLKLCGSRPRFFVDSLSLNLRLHFRISSPPGRES
jgi:hypothetical protein